MQKSLNSSEEKARLLDVRIQELRSRLRSYDPERLAEYTRAEFSFAETGIEGEYHFAVWDRAVRLTYPEFHLYEMPSGAECNQALKTLVLYYFLTADGTPSGAEWISFTDLPDGRFYTQAFQGYTGDELRRKFGDAREAFEQSAITAAGKKENLGASAYSFQMLPRISLLAVCWLGDDDFPTRYQILFNSNISHYLPTDACAIAGSMLTRRLIEARI